MNLIKSIITLGLVIILMYVIVKNRKLKREIKVLNLDKSAHKLEKELYERENRILKNENFFIKKEEMNLYKNNMVKLSSNLKYDPIFEGKKLLLGDYNDEMLSRSRKVFMLLGFEVDIVRCGEDLIKKIQLGYKYDVIITGNTYKDFCHGEKILRELKKIKNFKTPIVVLTVSINQRNEFLSEDFDGYLEKPASIDKAKEVLKKLNLDI